ncbi:MAG: radical SAM protein [Thermodesulfobacteriota bacterium]
MKETYPKYVKPGHQPFDPLELAASTEEIACKDSMRKYTDFYCTGVYGGISTGYAVGCCLRCIFCWVDFSRDFPEEFGRFYSPESAFEQLLRNAKKDRVKRMRISGGEPTLCRSHLLGLLDLIEGTNYLFILETNGILLGVDEGYVRALTRYKNIHLRVSLKAGSPGGFEKRTGARGDFYELPYQAIGHLMREGIPLNVAAMSDSRLMPSEERASMLSKLKEIGYKGFLEEEACDPYPHTIYRLKEAGWPIF